MYRASTAKPATERLSVVARSSSGRADANSPAPTITSGRTSAPPLRQVCRRSRESGRERRVEIRDFFVVELDAELLLERQNKCMCFSESHSSRVFRELSLCTRSTAGSVGPQERRVLSFHVVGVHWVTPLPRARGTSASRRSRLRCAGRTFCPLLEADQRKAEARPKIGDLPVLLGRDVFGLPDSISCKPANSSGNARPSCPRVFARVRGSSSARCPPARLDRRPHDHDSDEAERAKTIVRGEAIDGAVPAFRQGADLMFRVAPGSQVELVGLLRELSDACDVLELAPAGSPPRFPRSADTRRCRRKIARMLLRCVSPW